MAKRGVVFGQVLPLDILYKMAKPGGVLNKDTLEVCVPINPLADAQDAFIKPLLTNLSLLTLCFSLDTADVVGAPAAGPSRPAGPSLQDTAALRAGGQK